MKAVLIEPQKRFQSFTPYWRNDLAIAKEFGTPVVNNKFAYFQKEKIDWIFFVYASFWADFKEIADFANAHPESAFGWIVNEYNLSLNTALAHAVKDQGKSLFQITSFELKNKKIGRDYIMTNLNTLIFSPDHRIRDISEKKYDLIYYGMFRKGRELYFKRYFDERLYCSTSKKNVLFFKELCSEKRPKFIAPFLWGNETTLDLFRFSLYIEDEYSHSTYTYPANRFYEALMSRTILLFDVNARTTFDKAGYDVSDYLVSDASSLWKKIAELKRNLPLHIGRQAEWRKQAIRERKRTIDDLRPYFDGKGAR